jgi:pimeloyl-ACP methyl ester carboxylesterase
MTKYPLTFNDYFSVKEYGVPKRGVVFLFGGWRFPAWIYTPLIAYLKRHGFKCILYIPQNRLIAIGTEYSEVVVACDIAAQDVTTRIRQESSEGVSQFSTFGISFGGGFALEVGKRLDDINRIVLIAPFGDMEEHIPLWQDHHLFRKIILSQSTSLDDSGKVLNQVGPAKNLERLENKKVLLYYGTNDKIMHTKVLDNLVLALQEADIDLETLKISGGHYSSIFKHIVKNRGYIDFLSSK